LVSKWNNEAKTTFVMQVTSPLAVLYSTSTMEHHHFDQAHSSPLTNCKFRHVPVLVLPRNYFSKEIVVVDFLLLLFNSQDGLQAL
jgi:hypothetical protein